MLEDEGIKIERIREGQWEAKAEEWKNVWEKEMSRQIKQIERGSGI